jgi:hypothetical protein
VQRSVRDMRQEWSCIAREILQMIDGDLPPTVLYPTSSYLAHRKGKAFWLFHPDVIEKANQLRPVPAKGIRCQCGYGMGWLTVAPMDTGISPLIWPHRRSKRGREGGVNDLAGIEDPERAFTLNLYDVYLRQGVESMESSSQFAEVMLDGSDRVTFWCQRCGKKKVQLREALIRHFLEATKNFEDEFWLDGKVRGRKDLIEPVSKEGPSVRYGKPRKPS